MVSGSLGWAGIYVPWKRLARASVGLPLVGTGQWKALCSSSSSGLLCNARLRTLPAFMLRRLPDLLMLLALRSEDLFLRVLFRDSWTLLWPSRPPRALPVVEPEKELERWMLPAMVLLRRGTGPLMMELPRWLASHSSVNLGPPPNLVGAGAMRWSMSARWCEFARVLERVCSL